MDAAERALIKLGLRPERVVENNEVSLYSERHRFSVWRFILCTSAC